MASGERRLESANGVQDQWVLFGLLALLVWAPLPLGSHRVWANGILIVWVLVLLLGAAWAWRRHPDAALERLWLFRWPLGLLLGMVALAWLQTLPLPAAFVEWVSPGTVATHLPQRAITLSLDVFQSRRMASLAFVYFSAFLLSVLTVRDSRRLDWLAQALVVSGLVQALVGTVFFSLKANYRIFYSQVDHANMIGTFVNRNHMAGYLCMCLSVGIGLMLARLGTHKVTYANWRARVVALIAFTLSAKMRLRLLLVVMVIALVLTTSRMGNAAFFTALLVTGVVALVVSRHSAPHTMFLIASLVAVDILVVGAWIGLDKVVERIQ